MSTIGQLKVGSTVTLEVTPTYEIFYREGYGIYNTELESGAIIVIKGNFALPLNLHQMYTVKGKVILRGLDKQIDVISHQSVTPKGSQKVITYLQQLKGLKKRAEKIYDVFGDKSIEVLKKNPKKVSDTIKGISLNMTTKWQKELLDKEAEEKDILYLLNLGLSGKQAVQLRENYGSQIREKIRKNPYILLSVKGASNYGFLKCDELAKKIGFDFGHPTRIKMGLLHALKEAGRAGHTFLPKEKLVEMMGEILSVNLTFTQMKKLLNESKNTFNLHSRTFVIDLDDLEKRLKKIDSLKKATAKEKYRYPLFEIEEKHVENAIESLEREGKITVHLNRIALSNYEDAEKLIADNVFRLSMTKNWEESFPLEKELERYVTKNNIVLEKKQKEAVIRFAQKDGGFYILNGSAGCGKTFTLKVVLAMLEKIFKANNKPFNVSVMAPTGRASKVAARAMGYDAETIHRGLEFNPEVGFQRNRKNPLDASVLVVDEFSMTDASLASHLFNAVRTGTKVILMGDTKQLPSVGAGNVLSDLIESNVVEVVTLDVVKRQDAMSGIIRNANHIINGEMMETQTDTKDAFIIHEESDVEVQRKTIASIKRLMDLGYTLEDIQVLVPQKRGSIGVHELNKLIQSTFNPQPTGEKLRNIRADKIKLYFQKGDKVIHNKNNYNKAWYKKTKNGYQPQDKPGITNGETGVIEDIDVVLVNEDENIKKVRRIIVKYDSGYTFYMEGEEVKELDHAYCLSIHKSQGSQWPAIIMPISTQHSFFLDRNLIYTAWTRAESFGTVIGPKKTLAISIRKENSIKRYTQLQNFLNQQKIISQTN